jgi:hypothetical protein
VGTLVVARGEVWWGETTDEKGRPFLIVSLDAAAQHNRGDRSAEQVADGHLSGNPHSTDSRNTPICRRVVIRLAGKVAPSKRVKD